MTRLQAIAIISAADRITIGGFERVAERASEAVAA